MTLTRAATLSNNNNKKKKTLTLLPPQPLEQPCRLPQQQSTQPQEGISSASGGGSRQQGMKKVSFETKKYMALGLQKEWKAKLHRHYKQYASAPDLARETPTPKKIFGTRRTLEEWRYLVDTLHTNEQYQKGENPTYISNWNNMHILKGKSMWINEAAEIKGKKMNEEYEKAKQQVAESSGTPLDQVTLPIPQQLEIMIVELGVAKGKRIRGLCSSLRMESSHSGGVASSFATEQKVEELEGTIGELKGTVSELQGIVGKLLDVIEWMRTHDGRLPSHLGVLSQHVGDSPCDDDQGKTPPFCATTTSSSTTPWIFDSGATSHIAPPCGLCITTPLNSSVNLHDGSDAKINGLGSSSLGPNLFVDEVLCVPYFVKN
ncbi:hypothetical protein L3X38_019801 [Prunus dulcis]|uniref:Uncharacterized protein n=1 Tax=Prunus dulcis TaxID=3755 RepID=A0AAD4WDT2_PRUDU|nr:hypothetical protein L3X38_019801 [Prunus dulcis]